MADLFFKIPEKIKNSISKKPNLIVISEKDHKPELLDLLKAIVTALKLDFEADCELKIYTGNENIGRMSSFYQNCLIFGFEGNEMMFNITTRLYKIYQFDQNKVLFSESLSALQTDAQKKAALWKSLQQMYHLVKS